VVGGAAESERQHETTVTRRACGHLFRDLRLCSKQRVRPARHAFRRAAILDNDVLLTAHTNRMTGLREVEGQLRVYNSHS